MIFFPIDKQAYYLSMYIFPLFMPNYYDNVSNIVPAVSAILRCPLSPGQMSITYFSVSIPKRHTPGGKEM